jgi:hypothetical protein
MDSTLAIRPPRSASGSRRSTRRYATKARTGRGSRRTTSQPSGPFVSAVARVIDAIGGAIDKAVGAVTRAHKAGVSGWLIGVTVGVVAGLCGFVVWCFV